MSPLDTGLTEEIDLRKKSAVSSPHDSDMHELHNKLGIKYYKSGNYERALEEFKKAVELKKDFAKGYNNLGLAYYKLSMLDDARQSFQKAIMCNESYYEAYNNLGSVYLDSGAYGEALTLFMKAKELADDTHVIDMNLTQAKELKLKRDTGVALLTLCLITLFIFFLVKRAN